MANNCLDTRNNRTKCSDSRKRAPLRSWIWCILLKCVIGLPCIFSECLGVNITVATYPTGTISVLHGDPLEIFCVAESYTSDDLEFTLSGNSLKSEKVNETTRRLYIENPEKQLKAYYCRNNKTGKVCVNRVLVESPPPNVTDFNCISRNLDKLNCSWNYPVTYTRVNYTLTFVIEGSRANPPCIAKKEEFAGTKIAYCIWNTTSQPRYRQQEATQHFYLTACNIFGCNNQSFSIDHYSIVKPDPPFNLKVVKNGTHSVGLKWSIPNNMVDLLPCGVEHIIEYQIAKIDNTTFFHRVDASTLRSKNETYKFQLSNLPYAHMQYEVRIYIKSKKAEKREYWSDYSYIVFYTASERPRRPPEMVAGAFDQGAYADKRMVYVYWKQLEEYEEAGANFTYKVLITEGNKTLPIMYPDKNRSLSFINKELSYEALEVVVWSVNANGSSVNSSHLYIPAKKDIQNLGLTSFTKIAYENGTYELSWVGITNIDNYTLFWCHYNTTNICGGRLDFAVLDPKKHNHIIDLPREYRYQFAISANNGTKTSGMVWAMCDISKDGFVMYKFPVQLQYDVPGKSSVKLKWTMNCALKDGIITGYNISYCPIVQTSTSCDKSYETKYKFISDPKKMDVFIDNLLPYKTYQFTLGINTTYGEKYIENATTMVTTTEDTPTSPINVGVFDVEKDSLVISWDPPLQRNGVIGKYVIYNYGNETYVHETSGFDISRRQVTLRGLTGFTNYSLTVRACNIPIGVCSDPAPDPAIFVRTKIGPPSEIKVIETTNNPDVLRWTPPSIPGGTVDLYEIERVRDDTSRDIMNTTELSLTLRYGYCEGVVSKAVYRVRAVNFDEDLYHGVIGIGNVTLPQRSENDTSARYPGEWSTPSSTLCSSRGGLTTIFIFMGIFTIIAVIYASHKYYKKYRKMEDIKPVLPNGLGIPEKDVSKYAFGGWNPNNKDEKPSSDEMLLLPNSKTPISAPDNKQKNDNCAASDHTDSTVLSDSSRGPIDRQASISDDGSNSSSHLEVEPVTTDDTNDILAKDSFNGDTESSRENSPYFTKAFTKNPANGYVQPVVNPATGYVQSAPVPVKSQPATTSSQPAGSSYVMAALSPPIFTTGVMQPPMANPTTPSSGYVLPEEAQTRSMMHFPKLGPTKVLGPESLPTMPSLPQPTKHAADNSYIQLQSLDALPSLKPQVRNTVPLKPPTSSGYVSPGDVVINKHLNNMLSGQHADEPAILDPTMSPDAYCRFSWSTDPVNDNLHSFLADSTPRTSSKN